MRAPLLLAACVYASALVKDAFTQPSFLFVRKCNAHGPLHADR